MPSLPVLILGDELNGVFMSDRYLEGPTRGFIMCDGEDAPPAVCIIKGGSTCVSRRAYFADPRFVEVINLIRTACLDDGIYKDRLSERIATNDAGKPLVYSKNRAEQNDMVFEAVVGDLRQLSVPPLLYVELLPDEVVDIQIPRMNLGRRTVAVTFYEHVTGFLLRRSANAPLGGTVGRGYPVVEAGMFADGRVWYFLTYNEGHVVAVITEIHPDRCHNCLERVMDPSDIAVPPCGHVFHKNCLGEWLELCNDCPTCGDRIPHTFRMLACRLEQHG